ncbi:hypothetical protein Tco_0934672 [Tanacetum coccineum]
MEAYFKPFKNIIVFKKLIDILGSLPVQLKNTNWGNEGYGTYKKVEGDEAWHTKFEVTTPSGRKFTRMFKTKKTNRKLSGKFISEDILKFKEFTVEVVVFENDFGRFMSTHRALGRLRKKLGSAENTRKRPKTNWGGRQGLADRLGCSAARLGERRDTSRPAGGLCRAAGVFLKATQGSNPKPLFANFEKRNKQGVDGTRLMMEKCIWFRLCGVAKVITLPEFTVLLGLYEEDELNHGLFAIHFTKLEVDDKLFNHKEFWQKIGKLTSTNPKTLLINEPLMRIMHKLLVASLVHRAGSKERCKKRDMWMMSALEESQGINLAWVIAEHLCKHASGLKENSLIYGGYSVTKIAHSLGYLNEEEVAKCSEPIECETWTVRMLANELDEETHTLMQTEQKAPQPGQARRERQEPRGLDSSSIVPSSGYEIGGSSTGFHGEDFDPIVHLEDCVESDNDEMRD